MVSASEAESQRLACIAKFLWLKQTRGQTVDSCVHGLFETAQRDVHRFDHLSFQILFFQFGPNFVFVALKASHVLVKTAMAAFDNYFANFL